METVTVSTKIATASSYSFAIVSNFSSISHRACGRAAIKHQS